MSGNSVNTQPKNPLHGITLEALLTELVDHYGWRELAKMLPFQCFFNEPSISSSLKFLRKTPWARTKVENLWIGLRGKKKGKKTV